MSNDSLYSLLMALMAALSLSLFFYSGRKKDLSPRLLSVSCAILIALGFVLSKALFLFTRLSLTWGRFGIASLWQMTPRSFAMAGALLGVVVAILLTAPRGEERGRFFDALAVPVALFFVASRFLGGLLPTGLGRFIQTEALRFMPLGLFNEYGEWYLRLFLLEGLLALPALFYAWRAKPQVTGQRLALTVALLALPQVLCESLRLNSLKWGFVRAEQVALTALAFGILIIACHKGRQAGMPAWARFGLPAGYVALTAAAIGVEFMLDDGVGTPLLDYALLGLIALAMALVVFYAWTILSRAYKRSS